MQSYCRTSVAGAESPFSGMKALTTLCLVALTNACDGAQLDRACGERREAWTVLVSRSSRRYSW
jgi:hypothetical protein